MFSLTSFETIWLGHWLPRFRLSLRSTIFIWFLSFQANLPSLIECAKLKEVQSSQTSTVLPVTSYSTITEDFRNKTITRLDADLKKQSDRMKSPKSRKQSSTQMMLILIIMSIMFIGMCVALNLFSRARFKNHRGIFSNPRLLKIASTANRSAHQTSSASSSSSIRQNRRKSSTLSHSLHSVNVDLHTPISVVENDTQLFLNQLNHHRQYLRSKKSRSPSVDKLRIDDLDSRSLNPSLTPSPSPQIYPNL
ncbi:hypothetical protein SSS_01977 [Sarcoptes scabiei]|uniref:Uncharacterized protein n=1 Tax=Sarcoptes scabiei TaxID=52283 RepID=A0A834R0V5_SARSC|nr:hypothetical protein SSS_01977 [Sarcoptes scabiei]